MQHPLSFLLDTSSTYDFVCCTFTSAWTQVSVDLKHQLSHDSAVCAVRFSNSGLSLATGCKKAAHMYSVATGEKTGSFLIDSECYIRSVCFSPDDKQVYMDKFWSESYYGLFAARDGC